MNRREMLKVIGAGAVAAFFPSLALSFGKNDIADGFYIWGEGSPTTDKPCTSWSIGRLVGKGICYSGNEVIPCYHFQMSDGICVNGMDEEVFLRARKATWEEVYAAAEKEKGQFFGLNQYFLGD